MRALQQLNKLFIVNLSLFLGTVCICRPTLQKDTDQNVLPDDIGKSHIPKKKALNRSTFIYLYSGLSFEVNNSFLFHLALKWQVV